MKGWAVFLAGVAFGVTLGVAWGVDAYEQASNTIIPPTPRQWGD